MTSEELSLPPRLAHWLEETANRRQVTVTQVIRELREDAMTTDTGTAGTRGGTGKDLVEELTESGLIGAWRDRTDIGDPSEYARRLRERVWARVYE